MKLHYSQTDSTLNLKAPIVLIPYEITLFSNPEAVKIAKSKVLIPYEITLFSNLKFEIKCTHYNVHGNFTRLFYYIS